MRLLLTGKDGLLGSALAGALAPLGTVLAVGRAECDLTDADAVARLVAVARPDVIVNAAAYTAVDRAESEASIAALINGEAPGILGATAAACDALVVHFSTDYVFDGAKDGTYAEDDRTNPLNVYGRSKRDGELALAASGVRHIILRTSWLYGGTAGNFVRAVLRLAGERDRLDVVGDQIGAPTSAERVAAVAALAIAAAVDGRLAPGIYHLTASGATSWAAFARHIVARAASNGVALRLTAEAIRAVSTADYGAPAPRPRNSRLDCGKLEAALVFGLPDWRIDADRYIDALCELEERR